MKVNLLEGLLANNLGKSRTESQESQQHIVL